MKKWIALILALLLIFSLAACGSKTTNAGSGTAAPTDAGGSQGSGSTAAPAKTAEPTAAPTAAPSAEPTSGAAASEGNVTITVPAELVGEESEDDEEAENPLGEDREGVISVTENADGSITYVFTREKYEEFVRDMEESIEESKQQLLAEGDGELVNPIKKVENSRDYSSFKIYVDSEALTGIESFYALMLSMNGTVYQGYTGKGYVNVPTELVDAATGEIINTVSYEDRETVINDLFGGLFTGEGEDWNWELEPEDSPIPIPELEPAVLLDAEGVTVTTSGLESDYWGSFLKVEIVNNSEKTVMVNCQQFLVNDYSASGGLYTTVAPGETVEDESIYLPIDNLAGIGVEYIGKIGVQISVSDEETYETIVTGDLVELQTSDYGENWNTKPAGDVVYDSDGVLILFLGQNYEEYWGTVSYQYNFYVENNSGRQITVDCEEFFLDGNEISTWVYMSVPDGKRAIDYAYIYADDLAEYGIEDAPAELGISFTVYDSDAYEELFNTGIVEFELGVG